MISAWFFLPKPRHIHLTYRIFYTLFLENQIYPLSLSRSSFRRHNPLSFPLIHS
jgi:hypothetical protein